MGDVISSHLDEAKREIITGEEGFVDVSLGGLSIFAVLLHVGVFSSFSFVLSAAVHVKNGTKKTFCHNVFVILAFRPCVN